MVAQSMPLLERSSKDHQRTQRSDWLYHLLHPRPLPVPWYPEGEDVYYLMQEPGGSSPRIQQTVSNWWLESDQSCWPEGLL